MPMAVVAKEQDVVSLVPKVNPNAKQIRFLAAKAWTENDHALRFFARQKPAMHLMVAMRRSKFYRLEGDMKLIRRKGICLSQAGPDGPSEFADHIISHRNGAAQRSYKCGKASN